MKILVVEDEKSLSESICSYLSNENFICETAYDFHTAAEKIHLYEYACIVLDITLPHGNGLQLLKSLRNNNKNEGVLVISARNALNDKVLGLNMGADDYLTKPFHLPELSARIAAIIRRKSFDSNNIISLGNLILNIDDKTVRGENNKSIDLTRKEYELLVYFISNKNRVITKEAIVEHLWGDDITMADSYDFIYTHIKNLRKKLVQGGCPDYIKAVYGMGYKFSAHS